MQLNYSEDFKEEINEIYLWTKYKFKSEIIAQKRIKEIIIKIKNLKIFPRAYKLLKKDGKIEYRKFVIKKYIIIYSLESDKINLLHIYNQKLY
mgnify:FL=1